MSRRDPLAWDRGYPAWVRRDRHHTLHDVILYGLITGLLTHAILTVVFSPRRKQ